jgi:hypothetical protein
MKSKIDKPSLWSLMNILEQFLVVSAIIVVIYITGILIITTKAL